MLLPDKDPRDLYIVVWGNWYSSASSFLKAIDPEDRNYSWVRLEEHEFLRYELVRSNETTGLYFILPPGTTPVRFEIFWAIKSAAQLLGIVSLIDGVYLSSTLHGYFNEIKSSLASLASVASYSHVPYVVAAYGANHPDSWSPEDVPIIPFDVEDRESVKNVILQLLNLQLAQIEQLEAEAE